MVLQGASDIGSHGSPCSLSATDTTAIPQSPCRRAVPPIAHTRFS